MSKESQRLARQLKDAAAAEQRRRQRRINAMLAAGLAVIIGLLVTIVIVGINSASPDGPGSAVPTGTSTGAPANANDKGEIPVGQATAPVTMTVYFDYMCPYCKRFEETNNASLEPLIADGTLRVLLHPMAFLDEQSSGTHYSTRAANALGTVADQAPEAVWKFNQGLYAHQPAEGSQGLTDNLIIDIALGAGVPKAVTETFAKGRFWTWTETSTRSASKAGIADTPTVEINGVKYTGDLFTDGAVAKAVKDAASKAGTASGSPSASASASASATK